MTFEQRRNCVTTHFSESIPSLSDAWLYTSLPLRLMTTTTMMMMINFILRKTVDILPYSGVFRILHANKWDEHLSTAFSLSPAHIKQYYKEVTKLKCENYSRHTCIFPIFWPIHILFQCVDLVVTSIVSPIKKSFGANTHTSKFEISLTI